MTAHSFACLSAGLFFVKGRVNMSKVEDRVRELAQPIAERFGVKIYTVEYKKEGADWFLRIFLYKEEGIDIEDCENVSRELDSELDREDFISTSYYLEVSSPGLNRVLSEGWHFETAIGEPVLVTLYKAENGSKKIEGILKGYENDTVILDKEGEVLSIDKQKIVKVRLNEI